MRKISILLVIVVLMVAVMAVSVAGASESLGKGCYCHKMNGQAAVPALAAAHGYSSGKNFRAKPFAAYVKCVDCHVPAD